MHLKIDKRLTTRKTLVFLSFSLFIIDVFDNSFANCSFEREARVKGKLDIWLDILVHRWSTKNWTKLIHEIVKQGSAV